MLKHLTNTLRTSRSTWISFLALVFLSCSAPILHAQEDLAGFSFRSFTSEITIQEDGSFLVTETLLGDFQEPRHGLFRFIPERYRLANGTEQDIVLTIEGVDYNGAPAPFDAYEDGAFEAVRIGDADVTVEGPFRYDIQYRVERAFLYGEQEDELYWNVTGSEWGVEIPDATAIVTIPGVLKDAIQTDCYTGPVGSKAQECTTLVEDGQVRFHADDTLTISVRFPKGIVAEPTAVQRTLWWLQTNWDFAFIPLPFLVAAAMYVHWRRHGRDPKGTGTIIAEYEPPDGLRPTELGTLVDAGFHSQDFAAGVIDLAVRGYLHITESETGILAFKIRTYTVRRLKPADDTLKPFEKTLLEAFGEVGTEQEVRQRVKELRKARKDVGRVVLADMAERGYYVKNPGAVRMGYFVVAAFVAFAGHFIGTGVMASNGRPIVLMAFTLCAGAIAIAGFHMVKRTEQGTRTWEHAKGFKLFLETAEKDRLQWQEKEGMFERFLPYAMALGVVDKWAKAFEGLNQHPPGWYSGNLAAFSAVEFANRVESFATTTSQASSPNSGGAGGGSSGGGFGGGGGGSW